MEKYSVSVLAANLDKVYCGGMIRQCIAGDDFSVVAVSEGHPVVCQWSGLDDQVFDTQIGIGDLQLLKKALLQCGDQAYVYTDHTRLVVASGDERVESRLVLMHPDNITTKVPEDLMAQVDRELSSYNAQVIPGEVLDALKKAQRIIGSETLRLQVSTEGSVFHIGHGTENIARIRVPELVGDQEYTLALPSDAVQNILGVLYLDGPVNIRLSGPASIIEIAQGDMRYIVSPIAEE